MRIRNRLINGSLLNLIAVFFNQGSTLIVNVFIARILMKQTFGEFAMVQNTLLTAVMIFQVATGYTAAKYIAEYRSTDPDKAGRIMGLCAIACIIFSIIGVVILIVLAPFLSINLLKNIHLSTTLIIGSSFVLFSSFNGYQLGALSGLEAYGSLAKAGIISGIATVTITLILTFYGGLNGAFIGLGMSSFVRCLVHSWWLRIESLKQNIRLKYDWSFNQEKKIIFKFTIPSAIAGCYTLIIIWFANSFLVRQPDGYGEMALFASSSSLRILVLFIPQVINNVTLSVLNHRKGAGDQDQYKLIFNSSIFIIFLFTAACAIFIGFFAENILGFFGKNFKDGDKILQILMVSAVFEAVSIFMYQHLQTQGKIWTSFFLINIPREALFLYLVFMLVPNQFALGLSKAYFFSWLLTLVIISFLVYGKRIMINFKLNNIN